jgi:hypothetical protein
MAFLASYTTQKAIIFVRKFLRLIYDLYAARKRMTISLEKFN